MSFTTSQLLKGISDEQLSYNIPNNCPIRPIWSREQLGERPLHRGRWTSGCGIGRCPKGGWKLRLLARIPICPFSGWRNWIRSWHVVGVEDSGGISRSYYEHLQCYSITKGTVYIWGVWWRINQKRNDHFKNYFSLKYFLFNPNMSK